LSKTLAAIFMRIGEVTEIHATTAIDPIDELLSAEAQVNVYRIVQECVNNIIKHSQATEASLTVKRRAAEITLLVTDNGRGFPGNVAGGAGAPAAEAQGDESQTKSGGFGLIGIAERVKMLHGSCELESTRGTIIRINIPL